MFWGSAVMTVDIKDFAIFTLNAQNDTCKRFENIDKTKTYEVYVTSTPLFEYPVTSFHGILIFDWLRQDFGVVGNTDSGFYIKYQELDY